MLEVNFESNINGVIEEITDSGYIDTVTIWEPLQMQPEEFSEGNLSA